VGAVDAGAFSDEEVAAALEKHPQLTRTDPGTVEGEIEVFASYDGEEIKDRFKIRITKANPASDRVPALYEIGGRTNAIALKWNLTDLRDLHRSPDGEAACVCVRQEEKDKFPLGADLAFFIEGLARDYLYGLAFYDRHGRWPWGERSHGGLGLLEFYAEDATPQTREAIEEIIPFFAKETNWLAYGKQIRRPRGHNPCLCGSGKAFRSCHPTAWQGLLRLVGEMDRLGLKARRLFDAARARMAPP
jgi:hypothetical protein